MDSGDRAAGTSASFPSGFKEPLGSQLYLYEAPLHRLLYKVKASEPPAEDVDTLI